MYLLDVGEVSGFYLVKFQVFIFSQNEQRVIEMAVGLREGDAAAKKAVHGKLHVSTKKKTKKEQRERERETPFIIGLIPTLKFTK